MSQSTAGKGPGLVLRASNRSGACKISVSSGRDRALLEVLEMGKGRRGGAAEIGLDARELRELARALNRVALAMTAVSLEEDTTAHGGL